MVQRLLIFTIVAFIAYGCASSKKAADISLGDWQYIIRDLPDGDAEGTLRISKEGDQYMGMLIGQQGELNLDDVVIENDELVCTFKFSGYTIDMEGTFVEDTFEGSVSTEGLSFPMTAKRKQQ